MKLIARIAFAVNLRCYADIFTIIKQPQQKKQANQIQIFLKNQGRPQKIKYFKQSYEICKKISKSQNIIQDYLNHVEQSLDYNKFQQIFNEQCQSIVYQKSQYLATINFKISLFFITYEINPFENYFENVSIEIRSQIPIGKCLGSSASFNTILASALLIIFYKKIKNFQNQTHKNYKDNENFKQQVNYISKLFEKVEHGNPSGIDNYVSVFGGLVQYNKKKQPNFIRITNQAVLKKLTQQLIIGFEDSCIPKNTKQAVSNVRQKYVLHQKGNQKYKKMIEQIGRITQQILKILQSQQSWIERLFLQIQKNHFILKQLGVSNQRIQQIVKKNTQKGKICSKITGSGMGGYVLILSVKQQLQLLKKRKNILISKISKQGLIVELFQ